MLVAKKFSFESAHFLPNYDGPCKNLHGHRWEVEVVVEGVVGPAGMVIDFKDLKSAIEPVIGELDHQTLNSIIENPTAEMIAIYLVEKIKTSLDRFLTDSTPLPKISIPIPKVRSIKVWESPDSYVEVRG